MVIVRCSGHSSEKQLSFRWLWSRYGNGVFTTREETIHFLMRFRGARFGRCNSQFNEGINGRDLATTKNRGQNPGFVNLIKIRAHCDGYLLAVVQGTSSIFRHNYSTRYGIHTLNCINMIPIPNVFLLPKLA